MLPPIYNATSSATMIMVVQTLNVSPSLTLLLLSKWLSHRTLALLDLQNMLQHEALRITSGEGFFF